jgi:hemoglobin/transferrin/lactoferrin receptor protein
MIQKKWIAYTCCTWLSIITSALVAQTEEQDSTPITYNTLDEVVLSSGKNKEKAEDISSEITVIKSKNIKALMPQTTADALIQNGAVFVQKSQMGGGSPSIRGFEANKVLLVVDGVRMNNAIFRGGHLQNIISVDPNALERMEVFNGPGSVIYGSDALGGVIHMFTATPYLAKSGTYSLISSGFIRASSANKENTFHGDINYGKEKWASYTSFTFSNYNDLRMGKNNSFYRNDSAFGNKQFYAIRLNGNDTFFPNPNPRNQLYTGYSQFDLVQKVLVKQNEKVSHLFNIQYSKSSNVPRYDRLTEMNGSKPKYSEWFYGPQVRAFASYQLQLQNAKWYDDATVTAAYQNIKESRYNRRYKSNNLEVNEENLDVISVNADFSKRLKKGHEVRYGAEYFYNFVESIGNTINIETDAKSPSVTRYPNGSTYSTAGLYLTDRWELNKKVILSVGGRLSYFDLASTFDPTYFPFNELSVKQSNTSANGHVGLVLKPIKKFRIVAQLSTGFRNPNVDDMSKTFEQTSTSVVLPNTALKPEQVFSQEVGFDYYITKRYWVDFRAYNTEYTNAIAVKDATFNGNDSILYNGSMSKVRKSVNIARANIYGFSSSVNMKFSKYLSAKANISYTYGRDKTDGTKTLPLDHIPPLFASVFLGYERSEWSVIASGLYNGKKDIKDYSNSGEDNQQYAPDYGTPAWYTLNLKGSYTYHKTWIIRGGVENILDKNYRYFASGLSAAGRNFVLSLGYKIY